MRIIDRSSDVCSSDLLIPEGVFDKVFGQERSSQQAPQLNTRFVDGVSPRRRSKSGQRCNCAGVAAHHRGCQMDQGVPVLLNQSGIDGRSEEHTSELQSLMRISYAVFCLKKKNNTIPTMYTPISTTTVHTHTVQQS